MKSGSIKDVVKEKYGQIAVLNDSLAPGSCGCCAGDNIDYTIMSDNYTNLAGYNPNADLGLGCGIPTEFAGIKEGDTVLDLGSGAGNDCFVALREVGPTGKVIGLDMTQEMIDKAEKNKAAIGLDNIEFILGEIEQIPLPDNSVNVVISNCVLNLVPDKDKAFKEIFRILKPGGRFSVSDIVTGAELPENVKKSAEMYAGCVAGALLKDDYMKIISDNGFASAQILKQKNIEMPDSILKDYLNEDEIIAFKQNPEVIMSITVVGVKI
ncbi:MAG: arsenite methyltransferase [Candidatus Kapabacteria bacterium]|nr:arsenite methyltransferase [Candidatus Kapabacteria bacterium]